MVKLAELMKVGNTYFLASDVAKTLSVRIKAIDESEIEDLENGN